MNKQQIIELIAFKLQCSKVEAERMFGVVFTSIIESLKDHGKVSLAGIGNFSVGMRAAREGINPKTKERISIPAKKTIKFKAAKKLKDEF